MSSTSTLARPLLAAPEPEDPPGIGLVLLAAVVRAALIAVSGLVLVVGVALLLWAVTPDTGAEPTTLIRGGIGAFAAAHLMPVTIGAATLTIPPLLLTLLFGGFLAAGVARGRVVAEGMPAEAACAVLGAAAYTAVVLGALYLGAPDGAIALQDGWRAALFALVAAAVGTAVRGTAWRARWIGATPYWLQVGVRTGVAGAMMLIAGGALALVVALVRSFATAAAVGEVAAPTAGDAFGMAVLGLVYLPTAVLAATGYVTGPGFQIGAGTYSPLGSHGIELPAVPLLAAVPPTGNPQPLALLAFLAPAVAAVVVGIAVVRRVATRSERLAGAAVAGLTAAGMLTALLAVAGGGISGSTWAHLGVPLGWYAGAVAVEIGVPAMAWAAAAGWAGVPWRPAAIKPEPAEVDAVADQPAEGENVDDESAGLIDGATPEVLVWDITEGLPDDKVVDGPAIGSADADSEVDGHPGAQVEEVEGEGSSEIVSADPAEVDADLRDVGSEPASAESSDSPSGVVDTGEVGDVGGRNDADPDVDQVTAARSGSASTREASDPDGAPPSGRGPTAQAAGMARALRGHRRLRRRRP